MTKISTFAEAARFLAESGIAQVLRSANDQYAVREPQSGMQIGTFTQTSLVAFAQDKAAIYGA